MPRASLRLTGPAATGIRVNARLLRTTLDVLVEAVEESVRLRVEGRSKARGARPGWLEQASAFEVEIAPGSTEILLFAKPLAELCPDVFAQSELFHPLTNNPTGIDVFGSSFADVVAGDRDSDRYDDGFLETVTRLGRVFDDRIDSIEFVNGRRTTFTRSDLERVRELRRSLPPDQRARVAGKLDALRHSRRTFELLLPLGERVRGVLSSDAGEVAEVGPRLGADVVVEGTAKFRASGRLLRLEADWISAAEGDLRLWAAPPRPLFAALGPTEFTYAQGPRSGASAIFGKWPGDESDEEVEAALREIS